MAEAVVRISVKDLASAVLRKIRAATKQAETGFERLKSAGGTLSGVLAGVGAGAALKGIISSGVEADRTARRLKILSEGFGETEELSKIAGEAAKTYAIGNTQAANAVADLYGRLRPTGIGLADIKTTFLGVNTAAAKMNLTAAETDGVLLQLSQALGSGTLQGDELRSVMERLPAVGQAVAESMGVTVGELKALGAEGKLTTDVVIKGLQELSKQKPPEPDAYKVFSKALADLSTIIGTQLLPAFTPLVQFAGKLISLFGQLPGPLQTVIAGFVALGGALVIAAPIISVLAPALSALPALFAAITGVIGSVVAALTGGGGLLGAIAAVFTGPVGWVVLIGAAIAAVFTFRKEIAAAFSAIFKTIRDVFSNAFNFYKSRFIDPLIDTAKSLFTTFQDTFRNIGEAMKAPFAAAFGFIRQTINNILRGIARSINNVVKAINSIIAAANQALAAVGLPGIPFVPFVEIPAFAEGGVVSGPTLAMVGEGGEKEYIIPESKAARFSQNYLGGMRGPSAIPGFAEGGMATPSVSIQTGPVTQMNGTDFVTTQDLGSAVQAGVEQTLQILRRDGTVRKQLGLA